MTRKSVAAFTPVACEEAGLALGPGPRQQAQLFGPARHAGTSPAWELLGHAHIGVTAGVYAHVRLRLQRRAIDTLGNTLGSADDGPEDPVTFFEAPQQGSWPPGPA